MKRIISCLLAFVLICTPYVSSQASEPEPNAAENTQGSGVSADEGVNSDEAGTEGGSSSEQEEPASVIEPAAEEEEEKELQAAVQDAAQITDSGQIDVSVRQALILDRETVFTVSLTGQAAMVIS